MNIKCWISAIVLTCAMVWAGHSSTPPPIPVSKRPHKSAAIHQGRASLDLIAKPHLIVVPVPTTNTVVWLYPPGIVASNYWWDIQQATATTGPWSVLVTNASGAFDVHVNKDLPLSIYRLRAKLAQ